MTQPRYAHALVAQGGCLYALGGQASKGIHRWPCGAAVTPRWRTAGLL
jgi:hypothetical protein